jgi:hypothetical protein
MSGLLTAIDANPVPSRRECRVSARFACDTEANCQPPSARAGGGDMKWPGRIRDVSATGLSLLLRRRFETGAGLAIDVPGPEGAPASTLYAKVVRVKAEPGGLWLLGCKLVSGLSEEEIKALVVPPTPAAPPRPEAVFSEVHFRGARPEGGTIEFMVRRLTVPGRWPPAVGRTVLLRWHGRDAAGQVLRLRVDACRSSDGRWHLECSFVGPVPAQLLVPPAERI